MDIGKIILSELQAADFGVQDHKAMGLSALTIEMLSSDKQQIGSLFLILPSFSYSPLPPFKARRSNAYRRESHPAYG